MKNTKYTKEFLEPIVKISKSMRDLLSKLDLQCTGGNQTHIKKCLKKHNLDYSHFTGQSWSKGKTFPPKYELSDYLTNKRYISSNTLKHRLFKEKIFNEKCYSCGLETWLNTKIPLELHHKDNNHLNNSLDNLLIVCPNCHAHLHKLDRDYHRNINKKQKKSQKGISKPHTRKVERPSLETLEKEVQENGFVATGHKYGVSDNSIRKWIRFYKLYGQTSPN